MAGGRVGAGDVAASLQARRPFDGAAIRCVRSAGGAHGDEQSPAAGRADAGVLTGTVVVVRGGRFPADAPDPSLRGVEIPDLEVQVHEVTREQYDAFCRARGWPVQPRFQTPQAGRLPAEVRWVDAQSYAEACGMRLPTAAEFAWLLSGRGRAGRFPWGDALPPPNGVGNLCGGEVEGAGGVKPDPIEGYFDLHSHRAPVGSYRADALGLFDLLGNLPEWTSTWRDAPSGEPYAGERVARGPRLPTEPQCVVGGGSWMAPLSALECWSVTTLRPYGVAGFRCVRTVGEERPDAGPR